MENLFSYNSVLFLPPYGIRFHFLAIFFPAWIMTVCPILLDFFSTFWPYPRGSSTLPNFAFNNCSEKTTHWLVIKSFLEKERSLPLLYTFALYLKFYKTHSYWLENLPRARKKCLRLFGVGFIFSNFVIFWDLFKHITTFIQVTGFIWI